MNPYFLDLTLELSTGSLHNLGDIALLCRLTASNQLPGGEERKALVIERLPDWSLVTRELRPEPAALARLLDRFAGLGLPGRNLVLETVKPLTTGWEKIALTLYLSGRSQTIVFLKNGGAFGGADGKAFAGLLDEFLLLVGYRGRFSA